MQAPSTPSCLRLILALDVPASRCNLEMLRQYSIHSYNGTNYQTRRRCNDCSEGGSVRLLSSVMAPRRIMQGWPMSTKSCLISSPPALSPRTRAKHLASASSNLHAVYLPRLLIFAVPVWAQCLAYISFVRLLEGCHQLRDERRQAWQWILLSRRNRLV